MKKDKYIFMSLDSICPYIRSANSGRIEWSGKTRKIYDHQLMFFIEGEGQYKVRQEEYSITPGTLILIKPNTPHAINISKDNNYVWVHFDFYYRDDVQKLHEYVRNHINDLFTGYLKHDELIRKEPIFKDDFFFPDYIKLSETEYMEKLFKKLIFEIKNNKISGQLEAKAMLLQIFSEIIRQIFETEQIQINSPNYKTVFKITTFIEQNYYKKITIKDFEYIVQLSGDYISRILKKETGYSAIEYINRYRIKKAKDLLMHHDLKINAVAEMVGFNNIQYFSEIFKKFEGISPRDFCKRIKL